MLRGLLRLANGPLFILLALFAVGIQTALFQTPPMVYFAPNLLLLWVIWGALKRSFLEGGLLTLVIAEIGEVHSAIPKGVLFLSLMTLYLLTRLASRVVVLPNSITLAIYAFLTTAAHTILVTLVLILLGTPQSQVALHPLAVLRQALYLILPTAVSTAGLGYFLFRWFKQFDWVTFKDPLSQQVAGETGGPLFEEEGL